MSFSVLPKTEYSTNTDAKDKSAYMPVNAEKSADENVKGEPRKFNNKILKFVSEKWQYFAVPILVFALFFCVLYAFHVFPFGTDGMSNYDLLAQICPFMEHFFDVFSGKSSLFYSTAIIGGADVFGTLAYCCVSPFTWIFLLFGVGNVYNAISIVLPIKLVCIAWSALYYIEKHFKKIPDYVALCMAILYAYCGYMFVANTYVNWVDFLIYMPFVVSGFERLVKEGKIRYFAISYALMIYTCFSIASFALLMVFVILVSYVLIAEPAERRFEVLARICLALVVAVALALPIMVPSFMAYLKSGRNTGLFENIGNDLDAMHLYHKTSYVLSDTFFLFLCVVYFIKNGVNRPIDRFLLVTAIITLLPVFIDEVCNLLNAGSYMSYALRFGFLNAFYMFYVAGRMLDEVDYERKTEVKKSKKAIWLIILILVALVTCAVILLFNAVTTGSIELDKDNFSGAILEYVNGLDDFSGLYAHSLGGLEVIVPIAVITCILFTVATVFYKRKLLSVKTISFVLICTLALQVAFYNIHLVRGNVFDPLRYDQYNEIMRVIDENHEPDGREARKYYRVKDADDAITASAPFTTHTNSYSVFSSVIDAKNFVAPTFFEYKGNDVNCLKSANGLFLGDALLGYKYLYHHSDKGEINPGTVDRKYLKKLEDAEMENFTGYENTLVFPNAYTVPSGELDFSSGSYTEKLQRLYEFLGGTGDFFTTKDIDTSSKTTTDDGFIAGDITYYQSTDTYSVKIRFFDEGNYYLETSFPEDFDVYASVYTATFTEDGKKKCDGTLSFTYHKENTWSYYSIALKNYSSKTLTVDDIKNYCKIKCLTVDKVAELAESLRAREAKYTIDGGNTFNVSITAPNADTYLFMNYVALDGFKIKVNGHSAEFLDNGLNFMLVKLDEGENKVVIKYSSPYIKYGVYGLIAGLLIILAVWFIHKKQEVFNIMKPVISIAAIVLFIAVAGFFMIYPTCVFLVKAIKLPFSLLL